MGRRKHKAIQTNTIDVMLKILLLQSFNFETCGIKNFRSPRGLGREASRTMKFYLSRSEQCLEPRLLKRENFLIFPIIRNLLVRQSQRAWHRRIFMMENCWHISGIVIQLPFVAPSSVEASCSTLAWCSSASIDSLNKLMRKWNFSMSSLAVHAQTNPKLLQYSKWLSSLAFSFMLHDSTTSNELRRRTLSVRARAERQNVKGFSNAHNQHFSFHPLWWRCFLLVSFIFPYFVFRSLQPHKSLKTRITGRTQRRIHCEANPFKIKGIFDELCSH